MVTLGINGFGRIGRLALRSALLYYPDVQIGLINTSDSMKLSDWVHLFKYDSVYGRFPQPISVDNKADGKIIGALVVGDRKIPFTTQRDPSQIPWKDFGVQTVLESTGVFRDTEGAGKHIAGGAQKVIISAPGKGDVPFVMVGINADQHKATQILSNCSCTTYSVAPVMKIILDNFPVLKATLTTIHAYTADQTLVDGSHKEDIRRARAAAVNISPTSSGAAKAVIGVLPQLKGKFEASAIRVPVPVGSISDMTFILESQASVTKVNTALQMAAVGSFKGIVETTNEPIVSTDIIGNSHSAVVDLALTQVIDGNLVKVFSWYDNEWSYACRLVELAQVVNG